MTKLQALVLIVGFATVLFIDQRDMREQHCRIGAQQPADIAMQIVYRCDEYRR